MSDSDFEEDIVTLRNYSFDSINTDSVTFEMHNDTAHSTAMVGLVYQMQD